MKKTAHKITIPEPMFEWLNEVVRENLWLGSVETVVLEAVRDKMLRVHALGKRERSK